MKRVFLFLEFLAAGTLGLLLSVNLLFARTPPPTGGLTPEPTTSPSQRLSEPEATPILTVSPIPVAKADITQRTEETLGPMDALLKEQKLGPVWPQNPVKYAIRGAVAAGVPTNTIVLLLLLPGVATLIAGIRHLVGLRGFGIFLPAALSVVFVATGPVIGIGLFLVIVFMSTLTRITLRRLKIKLQYLPRMAFLLLTVVAGILAVLFAAPVIRYSGITNVSIFPVLILVLLAEDFSRVQLGKSASTAVNLTTETLILALISYVFLTTKGVQEFALLKPEIYLIILVLADFLLGKYVGLRLMEFWRFRRLITG